MAAEGIIKVSPELLSSTAADLGGKAAQLQTLTGQMLELADGLTSAWQGEAATAYITKFHQLDDDMQKMYRMIQEHSALPSMVSDSHGLTPLHSIEGYFTTKTAL